MGARYLQIQKDLLEKIQTGIYPVGETIPTEIELSQHYHVSRPTIRQAVQGLVDQGILEKRKRRGTMVCPPKIDQSFTQRITSFDSEMSQKGHTSQTQVLLFEQEKASDQIKQILKCDTVYKLVRLRSIDHTPNVFVTTYIPCAVFPDFGSLDFGATSFYDQCAAHGHPITSIKRHLEVTTADETLASLLQVSVQDPLFCFYSYGKDPRGTPIEYSISKYRGDTNSFTFTLSR